jgi:hypothetical protein
MFLVKMFDDSDDAEMSLYRFLRLIGQDGSQVRPAKY